MRHNMCGSERVRACVRLRLVYCNNGVPSECACTYGVLFSSKSCVPHLQIGGYYGNTGTATLAVAVLGAPLNDDFSNRVWLTNTTDFVIGSNIQASVEPNEPEHDGVGASVWYAFQAPALGTATISIPCKFF